MTKLVLSLVAVTGLTGAAFAGQQVVDSKKGPVPLETCFKDVELQLDIFGSYSASAPGSAQHGDGWGGGIGVNYFFTRNIGISASGNIYDSNSNHEVWNADLDLLFRFPIDSMCLAPYVLVGGGVETNSKTTGNANAGLGLEWRAAEGFGIFGEGRYYVGGDEDGVQARLGVRLVF